MRGLERFTKTEQKQNFSDQPDLADTAFRFFSTGAAEGGGFPLAFLFSFGLSLFFLSPFFLGGSRLPPDAEKWERLSEKGVGKLGSPKQILFRFPK